MGPQGEAAGTWPIWKPSYWSVKWKRQLSGSLKALAAALSAQALRLSWELPSIHLLPLLLSVWGCGSWISLPGLHCTPSHTQGQASSGPVSLRSEALWGGDLKLLGPPLPHRHLFLMTPINYSISNGGGFWKPIKGSSIPCGSSLGTLLYDHGVCRNTRGSWTSAAHHPPR